MNIKAFSQVHETDIEECIFCAFIYFSVYLVLVEKARDFIVFLYKSEFFLQMTYDAVSNHCFILEIKIQLKLKLKTYLVDILLKKSIIILCQVTSKLLYRIRKVRYNMQINSNYGSLDNYNLMRNLFSKHSNISKDDFDTFYENYQTEPLKKKQISDFFSNNNITAVRNFIYEVTPEELFNSHRIDENFNFTSKNTLNNTQNSVSFVPGDTFDLGDGYYLEITKNEVLPKCKNQAYAPDKMKEVSDIAGALNTFIRFANGQSGSMFFDEVQQNRIIPFLSKLGIDLSKLFTVNNSDFSKVNGNIQKQGGTYGQPTFTEQLTKNLIERAIDQYVNNFIYE